MFGHSRDKTHGSLTDIKYLTLFKKYVICKAFFETIAKAIVKKTNKADYYLLITPKGLCYFLIIFNILFAQCV